MRVPMENLDLEDNKLASQRHNDNCKILYKYMFITGEE